MQEQQQEQVLPAAVTAAATEACRIASSGCAIASAAASHKGADSTAMNMNMTPVSKKRSVGERDDVGGGQSMKGKKGEREEEEEEAEEEEEDGGGKKKKVKRPPTAYNLFVKERRQSIKV